MRMSRRLAKLQSRVQERVMFEPVNACVSEGGMASVKSSAWRPLSACVATVLRDVRIVKTAVVERPVATKSN